MKAIPMKATLAGFAILVPLALLAGYSLGDREGGEAIAATAPAGGVEGGGDAQEPSITEIELSVAEPDRESLYWRVEHVPPHYIRPGDEIYWQCNGLACAVHFSPISPFSQRRFMIPGGELRGGTVRGGMPSGKYSYFVAVLYERNDSLFIYTEDPDLIEEEGENDN